MAPSNRTVIVGIGSSAGGVEALRALFAHVPRTTGLGFVLVSHTARTHVSVLPEILGRCTDMPVLIAAHEQLVKPNHVYVGAADNILTIHNGKIELHARASPRQHKPIDVFLSSLAEDLAEDAIGIVLSGAGSDGTLGLKAIKERGGLTIVQGTDGSAPQHPSMPNTAIATGVVDMIVPVEQIGERLQQLARTMRLLSQESDAALRDGVEDELTQLKSAAALRFEPIYRLLVNQLGHDFSGYKTRTFARRVRRRMQVVQIETLDEYIDLLSNSAEEVQLLFRDLLIGVTNFFRDADAFQQLQASVVPKLFEAPAHSQDMTVRIWVPGCATGEEVYSIAILVREYIDTLAEKPRVQIFATDIDERALAVARAARYPSTLMQNVSEERLRRFFTLDDVSYVVNREVRELCIFSSHSVIRDPPFSRVDLISCRNLLIYLGTQFQAQVVPVFHFALRPRGYLFLGTSENVSQHSDLFTPLDKRQRIFQRRDHIQAPLQLPFLTATRRAMGDTQDLSRSPRDSTALRRHVEQRILERYAPVHVVVNADGDIVYYSARTGRYLEPPAGVPSRQLSAMARRGLRLELQNALREAMRSRSTVIKERVAVEIGEHSELANILVEPYGERGSDALYLVVFSEVERTHPEHRDVLEKAAESDAAERLELELREMRERLQSTIEEHETAVEELKSANEELQSINEELQSSNEELETSREELQSVNEELQTVNQEMNAKVEELDRANNDLRNLFESTQIATVFLDRSLIIRSFTPAVRAMFNLIPTDRGRPLTDFVSNLEDADLNGAVAEVMTSGRDVERQVRLKGGSHHYLMRVLPYRDGHNVVQGVVLTFVDVTSALEAEAQQRTLVEELNHRVRNMLTVVNAMANQTIERAPSLDAFALSFSGRIKAMAAAYSLVSRKSWRDVELKELLTKQLQIYRSDTKSVSVAGPTVFLRPNAALALGLVFHELTTNAIKYGALSVPTGSLEVTWNITDVQQATVNLLWRENGAALNTDAQRRGFGTELIERQLAHVLDAQLRTDYRASGLELRVSIPLDPTRLSIDGESDSGADADAPSSDC